MAVRKKITPFLWFDHQAEEAAQLYVSLFPQSKILSVARYGEGGPGPAGSAMTVNFELAGQEFIALNGGPMYKFTEAVSLMVDCEDQQEVDRLWNRLLADGGEESMCGWLKDRFGLSWQIIPTVLSQLIGDPNPEKARRATQAMLQMKKIDIAALQRAHAGG
ncbi:MAG TPA: VOC family protein [Anaerolineales bacterium]|nr:VOC family protein [Anaerolineales bacterium]